MGFNSPFICLLLAQASHANPECKAQPFVVSHSIGEPPGLTTKAPDPSSAQNLTCDTRCRLYPPNVSVVSWIPEEQIVYTEDITVGIISIIVYMDATSKATAVRTHLDYRWSGGSESMLPPKLITDEYDASFALTALTSAGTTTYLHLAYPHTFIDYATKYSWEGILSTSNEAGIKSCAMATAAPSTCYLSSHQLHPRPTAIRGNESASSIGRRFVPLWVPLVTPDETFFRTAFPLEQAINHCLPVVTTGLIPTIFSVPNFFWNYTTVMVWDSPTAKCSQRVAATSGTLSMDRTQGARYLNFSEVNCELSTVITLLVDGSGTATFFGDNPQQATMTLPPVTRNEDRPHGEHTTQGWEFTTDGDRTGYMPQRSRSTWSDVPIALASPNAIEGLKASESGIPDIQTGNGVLIQSSKIALTRLMDAVPLMRFNTFITEETRRTQTGGIAPPQRTMPSWDKSTRNAFAWILMPSYSPKADGNLAVLTRTSTKGLPNTYIAAEGNREFQALNPTEASLIAEFFDRLAASATQQDQSSNRIGPNRDLANPTPITSYIDDDPDSPAGPISGEGLRIGSLSGSKKTLVNDGDAAPAAANVRPVLISAMSPQLLLTNLPTVVNGKPTTVPAYIIPKASTLTDGEGIMFSGKLTTFSVPGLLPTYMPTIINNVPTFTLAYIVRGQSIATLGQTITLEGRSTVLATPDAVFEQIPTTVHGVATTTPVFVISGPSTASIGQTVILNGTLTVLTAPNLIPTRVTTMVDGIAEPHFAYVLITSVTVGLGETVALDGKTTVLSEPTGGPVVPGIAVKGWSVSQSAAFVGLGAVFIALL